MRLRNVLEFPVKGKKILLRVDINSPVYMGKPLDNPRFEMHGKTVRELAKKGAKIIIIAHQGRKGSKDFIASLEKHARLIEKHAKVRVKYVDFLFEKKAGDMISCMKNGEAILLRNVRDYDDEYDAKNRKNRYFSFSKMFDMYANDAFSVCHRSQGSVILPPREIMGYAGPALWNEMKSLGKFKVKGRKKMLFIIGGEKIEDYLPLMKMLKNRNARMIACGVLGDLIIYSKGIKMGYEERWLKEKGYLKNLPKIREILGRYGKRVICPVDAAVGKHRRKEIMLDDLPVNEKIKDIGKESIKIFGDEIGKAEAVFMKGPLGVSEEQGFSYGTVKILGKIAKLTKEKKIYSLIGGGHLTETIDRYRVKRGFSYMSLSGGALIKWITGEKLPGIEALKNSKN